jgi:probable F420-dependent oxidoreductase
MHPFRFTVNASSAPTMTAWRDLARAAESLGYSTLYLTDHLDTQYGPLVAMTVAAEATSTLHVGTLVLNNDMRNPVVLAKEIATLGLVAEGRIEVGLGAGWLSSDYGEAGIMHDDAATRVERLAESIVVLKSLWNDGLADFEGRHYTVRGARCDPRPLVAPKVIVGGGSRRILELASRQADIVNISLASSPANADIASKATMEHYDRCVSWVRDTAGARFDSIQFQITAATAIIVDSRRAAQRRAAMMGFPGDDALQLPLLLIGSEDELCERLIERRDRWGFSNIVVPDHSMESFAPVVARLSGT